MCSAWRPYCCCDSFAEGIKVVLLHSWYWGMSLKSSIVSWDVEEMALRTPKAEGIICPSGLWMCRGVFRPFQQG